MSEKALLVEIEKEKQKQVEKKLEELKKERKEEKQPKKEKRVNVFSSSTFSQTNEDIFTKRKEEKQKEVEKQIVEETENENIVEKPNFDMLETLNEEEKVKVFKVDKNKPDANAKPKKRKFALIVASVVMAIFGVWSIVNLTQINTVSNQITEVTTQYDVNLVKYMSKLKSLDTTSTKNMQTLIETIPVSEQGPATIEKTTNWFDRFCNFLSGLFN